MHAQPTADRSPFRKRGLSLAPLQQAVKSLASHEIKQRPGERANRRWEGPPPPPPRRWPKRKGLMVTLAFGTSGSRVLRSTACPAWCARGSSVKPGVSSALPTLPQCHGTLPDGTQHVALPEMELVPRLLSRAPRRPRGIPYPTKHWGLKNTCTASLSVLSPGDGGLK